MDITINHMKQRIAGLELVLLQLGRLYTNPVLREVVNQAVVDGDHDGAVFIAREYLAHREDQLAKDYAGILDEVDGEDVDEVY